MPTGYGFPAPCELTNYEGCKNGPHVHWHRTGNCGSGGHSTCPATFNTYGGRKVVNCPCPCHKGGTSHVLRRTAADSLFDPIDTVADFLARHVELVQ